jgi:hypothetical protein
MDGKSKIQSAKSKEISNIKRQGEPLVRGWDAARPGRFEHQRPQLSASLQDAIIYRRISSHLVAG